MNLREGTRRLALLLGVVGAIFGGVVSYFQLQSTMRQRGNYQRFEKLANSQATSDQRNCILGVVGEQGCREPGNSPYPDYTSRTASCLNSYVYAFLGNRSIFAPSLSSQSAI